ncbi:MAG: hypothetical protein AB2693_34915, partial [Candidatus Thiodiazotropha sp.]
KNMKLKRDLAMFLSVMKNTFGYVETFRSAITETYMRRHLLNKSRQKFIFLPLLHLSFGSFISAIAIYFTC